MILNVSIKLLFKLEGTTVNRLSDNIAHVQVTVFANICAMLLVSWTLLGRLRRFEYGWYGIRLLFDLDFAGVVLL